MFPAQVARTLTKTVQFKLAWKGLVYKLLRLLSPDRLANMGIATRARGSVSESCV